MAVWGEISKKVNGSHTEALCSIYYVVFLLSKSYHHAILHLDSILQFAQHFLIYKLIKLS